MYNIALLHEMIHPAYNLFLAIYLAHLLTDFVFRLLGLSLINIGANGAVTSSWRYTLRRSPGDRHARRPAPTPDPYLFSWLPFPSH